MKAYKIKVANEAESKEAQELFFALGYEWSTCGKKLKSLESAFLFAQDYGRIEYSEYSDAMFYGNENQEITLPQLRDLVKPQMTWQDALRAVADGKEVEVDSISDGWLDVTTCCIELLQELESFRIKPPTIFLNGGNYTKEQLLKIAGEME